MKTQYVIVAYPSSAYGSIKLVYIVETLKQAKQMVDDHNAKNNTRTRWDYFPAKKWESKK